MRALRKPPLHIILLNAVIAWRAEMMPTFSSFTLRGDPKREYDNPNSGFDHAERAAITSSEAEILAERILKAPKGERSETIEKFRSEASNDKNKRYQYRMLRGLLWAMAEIDAPPLESDRHQKDK